jgi:hypothetical protein
MSYHYIDLTLQWSRFMFMFLQLGSNRLDKWLAQPCTDGGHDGTAALVLRQGTSVILEVFCFRDINCSSNYYFSHSDILFTLIRLIE